MPSIEAIVSGVVVGAVVVVASGIRRIPWAYAVVVGVGMGIVFGTLRAATLDPVFDPGSLVLLGAVGGSLATYGFERGERARDRRTAAILAGHSPSPT